VHEYLRAETERERQRDAQRTLSTSNMRTETCVAVLMGREMYARALTHRQRTRSPRAIRRQGAISQDRDRARLAKGKRLQPARSGRRLRGYFVTFGFEQSQTACLGTQTMRE